tara:strand:- start:193 stop:351 length:159 start_codon:yes stop_codon:yes gene_type:complete
LDKKSKDYLNSIYKKINKKFNKEIIKIDKKLDLTYLTGNLSEPKVYYKKPLK